MLPTPTIVRARERAWAASPSPQVWRKRYHHSGREEAGQVSSLVRYDPGAEFREHDHPDGEEILVLDGTFSDQRGDFPAGSYLLSGQGFRHRPFSDVGCLLFVRLRQYPGSGRQSLAFDALSGPWESAGIPGVQRRQLYRSESYPEEMWLTRVAPNTSVPVVELPDGEEIFVVSGGFEDEYGLFEAHDWLRFPPGGQHSPRSRQGCLLYVARNRLSEHS